MTVPTGRDSDKFMLRLPDGMRDRIKAAAEANNRSMNAEIVDALETFYPSPLSIDEVLEWISEEMSDFEAASNGSNAGAFEDLKSYRMKMVRFAEMADRFSEALRQEKSRLERKLDTPPANKR